MKKNYSRKSIRLLPSPRDRRWGSVFWRSWARVIRGRLPAIGSPNAEILHHGPPPAYARGQAAGRGRGGAVAAGEPRRLRAGCAPRRACERRAAAAGWQVALAAAKFARLWILECTLLSYLLTYLEWG